MPRDIKRAFKPETKAEAEQQLLELLRMAKAVTQVQLKSVSMPKVDLSSQNFYFDTLYFVVEDPKDGI